DHSQLYTLSLHDALPILMFFPDKVKGGAEAHRVLRDGGRYLAIIWDRLDRNPVSHAISEALEKEFPEDPPRFLERMPFGYADMRSEEHTSELQSRRDLVC